MSTYNLSVTFPVTPAIESSNTETTFTQGFLTIVSIEPQYKIDIVEIRGGNE